LSPPSSMQRSQSVYGNRVPGVQEQQCMAPPPGRHASVSSAPPARLQSVSVNAPPPSEAHVRHLLGEQFSRHFHT
jgi:hypothetical protein